MTVPMERPINKSRTAMAETDREPIVIASTKSRTTAITRPTDGKTMASPVRLMARPVSRRTGPDSARTRVWISAAPDQDSQSG